METLDHSVIVAHNRDERVPLSVIVEPHIDRGLHGLSQHGVSDNGPEAGDDPPIDQPLDPRTRRVCAQTHETTELAMTYSSIHPELTENISVDVINHSASHCTGLPGLWFSVPRTEPSVA